MSHCGLLTAARRSLRYRLGRIYNSFYYSQSNNKYVMLFVFPSVIWYTRFRADTRLGYRLYIAPTAGGPVDYLDQIESGSVQKQTSEPDETHSSVLLDALNYVDDTIMGVWRWIKGSKPLIEGFKNGKKIYLDDSATVADLKKAIYGRKALEHEDVLVGCKGRVMQTDDNLALATRAFCRRDPRIVLWRDI
ncbi:hypothetical protein, conserved [Babesia bigemina]|uniref:Ubiquitin-like domain-containing protein n=1 Tax=Babesia bigemina TaxID=5866 RepID=A0A061DCH7_BABBI|nr:hypothetical protein, conserved [Babesia bigemina]CDR96719.1 hypothetical protein, conserved [Babesia bigemina]|eukprot:XP_012768905.1 hypothetical protein, conserved [Babesia bigemina]